MSDTSRGDEINRLADYFTQGDGCRSYDYSGYINDVRNTTWDPTLTYRQWFFQTCNEFGFYQTSDKEPHVFGHHFPLSFYIQQCVEIFGDKFNRSYVDAAVARTNTLYGALDIEVTNVVFVQGSIDPWHALGITKTRNPKAPAIFINGTGHCANLFPPSDDDLPVLKEAREQIGQLISTWLNL